MQEAIYGLLGLFIGVLLTEFFRRERRIENYSHDIFLKRLQVYEGLFEKISHARDVAEDISKNDSYSKEDRHSIWSEVVFDIAEYGDKHALYINSEISVHYMCTVLDIEEIYEIQNEKDKEERLQRFRDDCLELIRMIKKETGLKEIEKLFGSITKAKHKGPYIDYYRVVKRKLKREAP